MASAPASFDPKSFNLTELAFPLGLGDPVEQVVADGRAPRDRA
ncbi:hypothetical protein ACWEPM_33000 [Streptomyces sp. NPDC004244]